MIFLKSLKLNNFLSHADTQISFGESEKTLIDGVSGAGKSSIFDAIIWDLYGKGRTDNRSLLKKHGKKGSVCLELVRRDVGGEAGDIVTITRSLTSSGKHALEISTRKQGEEAVLVPFIGVREAQEWIEKELIGASYLLFINSVAYLQGGSESFVSQTAPKRKELLLEIVKAEDYKGYYEKARITLQEAELNEKALMADLADLNVAQEALVAGIGRKGALEEELKGVEKKYVETSAQRAVFEEKKAKFASDKQVMDVITQSLVSEETSLSDLNRQLASLKSTLNPERKAELVAKLSSEPLEAKIKECDRRLENAKKNLEKGAEVNWARRKFSLEKPTETDRSKLIEHYQKEIEHNSSKLTCPAGAACPFTKSSAEVVEHFIKQIGVLVEMTKEEQNKVEKWKADLEAMPPDTDLTPLTQEVDTLTKEGISLAKELMALEMLRNELGLIEMSEKQIPITEADIAKRESTIKGLNERKSLLSIDEAELKLVSDSCIAFKNMEDVLNAKLNELKVQIKLAEADEVKLDTLQKEVKKVVSEELVLIQKIKNLELVKNAFGSKGIETIVIDYLIPKLEDKINDILSKLSDFRVRIDTQRKSADGESMVEGLFIAVLNESGEELDFDSYSGGERLRITTAIQEALASLQKASFRLIDELVVGLDENMVESFTDVLERLQASFPQILMISHLPQVKDLFDTKILITKKEGTSYATN